MIKEELVMVNDHACKAGDIARLNDQLQIFALEQVEKNIDLPILFENEDLVVVDKPSGITSEPASGEKGVTVAEIISEKYDLDTADVIVHRLDKGTSGVMILAKNKQAKEKLQTQFKNRFVRKEYYVLVHGKLEPKSGLIDLPMARDESRREQMGVTADGREAVTEYSVLKYFDDVTLVSAFPKTGRTHQIRVHFSMIGHPVVGDKKYGTKGDKIGRIFLHARKISFEDPRNGKNITVEADIPRELTEYIG